MAYEVYGPYNTVEDVRKNIDILELEGLKKENIVIFANDHLLNEIKDRADATIEKSTETDKMNDYSLTGKMKNRFSDFDSESTRKMREKMQELGVGDEQTDTYMSDIASGKIILIVETDDKRMGHNTTDNSTAMEVPVKDRG